MLDLSTINSTTIANPSTVATVQGELDRVRESQNGIEAAILLHHLERQLESESARPVRESFSKILASLREIADSPVQANPSQSPVSEPVLIRNTAGHFQYATNGELIDVPDEVAGSSAIPKSVLKQQSTLQKTSTDRPVPVSYETPDDEEEIRRHNDRLSGFQLGDGHNVNEVIEGVRRSLNVAFSDEVMAKRFETIAASRLKDIRTSKETQELFVRPPKIGGLGLEPGLAASVVTALEQAAGQIRDTLPAVQPKTVTPAPEAPTPPKIPKSIPPPPPAPPRPVPVVPVPPKRVIPIRERSAGARPMMSDIRRPDVPTRLVGPIEELRNVTLDDFRQWGGGEASGSVRKVFEKIGLLGQESFSRRVEGVQAWRSSSVHALYLEMSRASLEQGKDVKDVVSSRQASGQPCLTEAEFHAIVDLNRQLRF